jgi:membrane protein YdbS with pleckstrin-like domain
VLSPLLATMRTLLRLPEEPPSLPGPAVQVFRASPAFLRYRYVLLGLGLIPSSLGVLIASIALFMQKSPWPRLLGAAIIIVALFQGAIALLTPYVDYQFRHYVVSDRSLRIREGVWILRELTLSFVNVQNVTIEQGPIERLLGIANVVVQTAGGGAKTQEGFTPTHAGVLRGISNAEQVRDLIRARLAEAHRSAGLGDEDDAHEAGMGGAHLELLKEIRQETRQLARRSA